MSSPGFSSDVAAAGTVTPSPLYRQSSDWLLSRAGVFRTSSTHSRRKRGMKDALAITRHRTVLSFSLSFCQSLRSSSTPRAASDSPCRWQGVANDHRETGSACDKPMLHYREEDIPHQEKRRTPGGALEAGFNATQGDFSDAPQLCPCCSVGGLNAKACHDRREVSV
jgi:hypothetical protein